MNLKVPAYYVKGWMWICTALVGLSVCIWYYFSFRPSQLPARLSPYSVTTGAKDVTDRGISSNTTPPIGSLVEQKLLDRPSIEELSRYLRKHNRSAESLVAAYDVTLDPQLLQEMIQRFPDYPSVCLLALTTTTDLDARLAWSRKLTDLLPDNGLGELLSAQTLIAKGKTEEAMSAFQAALVKNTLDFFTLDRAIASREAWQDVGLSPSQSHMASLRSQPGKEEAYIEISHLTDALAALQKNPSSIPQSMDPFSIASSGLMLAQRLNSVSPTTLFEEIFALRVEASLLEHLPPDADYGESGKSVAQRLNEVRGFSFAKDYAEMGRQAELILPHAEESVVSGFYDRLELRGERHALDWLIEQSTAGTTNSDQPR